MGKDPRDDWYFSVKMQYHPGSYASVESAISDFLVKMETHKKAHRFRVVEVVAGDIVKRLSECEEVNQHGRR